MKHHCTTWPVPTSVNGYLQKLLSENTEGQVASPTSQCHLFPLEPQYWTPLSFHICLSAYEKSCKCLADSKPSGRVPASSPLSLPAIQKAKVPETGLWGPRSVPPAVWQGLIFRQLCQVSVHVACCSNLFQITQKSRQKIKFHFVKVRMWTSPGLVRLHGQTHFLVASP